MRDREESRARARVLLTLSIALVLGPAGSARAIYEWPAPYRVAVTRDLVYGVGAIDDGVDETELLLDLYEPVGLGPEAGGEYEAGIVFVHGGGFHTGDKRSSIFIEVASGYAAQGFLVASINYRLRDDLPPAPEDWQPFGDDRDPARHAAAVDTRRAIRWMRAHAETLGVDSEKIFAFGISAGGATTVLAGTGHADLFLTDLPGQQPDPANHPEVSDHLLGVIDFWGMALPDFVSADDAPLLILHGTEDALVDFGYSVDLALASYAVGLEHRMVPLLGYGHMAYDAVADGQSIEQLTVEWIDARVRSLPEPNAFASALMALSSLVGLARRRRNPTRAGDPHRTSLQEASAGGAPVSTNVPVRASAKRSPA